MRPDRKPYTDALRQVRATLKSRRYLALGRAPVHWPPGSARRRKLGLAVPDSARRRLRRPPASTWTASSTSAAPRSPARPRRCGRPRGRARTSPTSPTTPRAPRPPSPPCSTAWTSPATEADVVTSAQAAARLLADKLPPKSKVLVLGATALRLAVRERGLIPVSTAGAPAGGRPGLRPRPRLRQLRRGRPGGQGGRALRRHQRGLDDPQRARHRARQRLAAQGHRARHGTEPHDRGQAGAAAAPRVGHPHRGQAPARHRRPSRHRHRGRLQHRDRQPARPHRRRQPPRRRCSRPPHRRPTYIAETLDALLRPYPP